MAGRGGHLRVLQWARENGCPWGNLTCAGAAGGGQLELLQWARANGCEWNGTTCYIAAHGGHLGVLQWARENGCEWGPSACMGASQGGHLEVLQWAVAMVAPGFLRFASLPADTGHRRGAWGVQSGSRASGLSGQLARQEMQSVPVTLC